MTPLPAPPAPVAMRHDNLIPGPVRWVEQERVNNAWVDSVSEGTALMMDTVGDDAHFYVMIVRQDGRTTDTGFFGAYFPINGPVGEPPRWHSDVAILGPVTPNQEPECPHP